MGCLVPCRVQYRPAGLPVKCFHDFINDGKAGKVEDPVIKGRSQVPLTPVDLQEVPGLLGRLMIRVDVCPLRHPPPPPPTQKRVSDILSYGRFEGADFRVVRSWQVIGNQALVSGRERRLSGWSLSPPGWR